MSVHIFKLLYDTYILYYKNNQNLILLGKPNINAGAHISLSRQMSDFKQLKLKVVIVYEDKI